LRDGTAASNVRMGWAMSGFIELLERSWDRHDSLVCVGLDPEIERFPPAISAHASPIFQFNKAIVDATADVVCAYKPQFAHYAAYEAEDQLEALLLRLVRAQHLPEQLRAEVGDRGADWDARPEAARCVGCQAKRDRRH